MNFIKKFLHRFRKHQIDVIVSTYINGEKSNEFFAQSFVGNFLQMLYVQMANNSSDFVVSGSPWLSQVFVKNTNDTNITAYSQFIFRIDASSGDQTKGIVVGSGDTPAAANDINLETIISNGNDPDELEYQVQQANQGCEISSLTTSFILQRLFLNTSGGQVDVNEVAILSKVSTHSLLMFRDVLPSTDEIPDGATYRINIEISVTT